MRLSIFVLVLLAIPSAAWSSGFEKSVMWSGHYAGYGSAAVSSVEGAQALFFNPAALSGANEISLNYSPTWINVKGSLVTPARQDESNSGVLPMGGGFAAFTLGKLGFGVGAYVSGGNKAVYPSVDLTPDSTPAITMRPILETDLTIVEYALGAGYELVPGFKVGGAWRIAHASGSLSTIVKSLDNISYQNIAVTDAKVTRYNGWRLGALFEDPGKRFGIGAAYRSKLTFDAPGTGKGAVVVIPFAGVTALTMADTRVGVVFPDAYSLGANYRLTDSWHVLGGADYVRYSLDDQVYMSGTANGVRLPNIPLNWSDMWNWRLGVEFTGIPLVALRAGYVRTSQVVSSTNAKATLPPAAVGNLFTVGAGFSALKALDLDAALEYGHASGTGSMSIPAAGATTRELLAGVNTETTASTYAVHLGTTYRF
jgi:long-subunit fatty acid transport protein